MTAQGGREARAYASLGLQQRSHDEGSFSVMAGLVPRLSGSILMDRVHGMDSSAF